ncbi:hypothetical protein HMPREF9099_01038 [Lachnospiraceae bacterium oral taxon 082 str. F0431]|nr:hypothetical protein HMPREF9099_01038 [Lachnospiraceae bacterium oral taxon 082 str. F0431]
MISRFDNIGGNMSLNIDVDITQANEELEGLREAKRSLEKIIDDYVNVGNKMKENWSGENADKFFNVKYKRYLDRLRGADDELKKLIKDIERTIDYIIEIERQNVGIVENQRR